MLSVDGVNDVDRGCNEPERAAGDVTCGFDTGSGELSQQLVLSYRWAAPRAECPEDPQDGFEVLAHIQDVVRTAPQELSGGDAVCVVLGLALPVTAENLVQGDRVLFNLNLGLEGGTSVGFPHVTVSRIPTATTGVRRSGETSGRGRSNSSPESLAFLESDSAREGPGSPPRRGRVPGKPAPHDSTALVREAPTERGPSAPSFALAHLAAVLLAVVMLLGAAGSLVLLVRRRGV